MADTAKHRNINNSANNGRKSKNEIIRSALGIYLKQRNYSVSLIGHSTDRPVSVLRCETDFYSCALNDFVFVSLCYLCSGREEFGKVSQI